MGKNEIIPELELGARPNVTEIEVVEILILESIVKRRVKFLRPSRIKDDHTPDILMDDVLWEIKSIEKLGKYTIEHALRAGLQQSDNLVVDLRKLSKTLETKALAKLEKEFRRTKSWNGLITVVRFNGKCLTYTK